MSPNFIQLELSTFYLFTESVPILFYIIALILSLKPLIHDGNKLAGLIVFICLSFIMWALMYLFALIHNDFIELF